MRIQKVRGERRTVSFTFRAPRRAGHRRLVFRGRDPDLSEDDLFGLIEIDLGGGGRDSTGPKSLRQLVRRMRRFEYYDGVRVSGRRAYRSEHLRIGGRFETTIRIVRGRR